MCVRFCRLTGMPTARVCGSVVLRACLQHVSVVLSSYGHAYSTCLWFCRLKGMPTARVCGSVVLRACLQHVCVVLSSYGPACSTCVWFCRVVHKVLGGHQPRPGYSGRYCPPCPGPRYLWAGEAPLACRGFYVQHAVCAPSRTAETAAV